MGIREKRKLSNHGICPPYLSNLKLVDKKPDREVVAKSSEVEVVVIIVITPRPFSGPYFRATSSSGLRFWQTTIQ